MVTRTGFGTKERSADYCAGHRRATRACIAWLHRRAKEMVDPHAKQILDSAAFQLGNEISKHPKGQEK
jgi:hypothetical protein